MSIRISAQTVRLGPGVFASWIVSARKRVRATLSCRLHLAQRHCIFDATEINHAAETFSFKIRRVRGAIPYEGFSLEAEISIPGVLRCVPREISHA